MLYTCLSHTSFKIQALLRAVLRDEMIAWNKKNLEPATSVTVDANGQQQVRQTGRRGS